MADEYERAYLGGDEALHREKRVSRATFRTLGALAGGLGLLATLSFGAFVMGEPQGLGGAVIVGGIAAMNGVLAVALSVARTVVTPRDLRFMVGIRNRIVPLASIRDVSIGTIQPATMRNDAALDRAEIASIFMAAGGYVRVAWTDETNCARVVWIGSDDPAALAAAIDRARRPPPTRVVEIESAHETSESREAAKARRA